MNPIRVSQRAYLGLEVSDVPAWEQFANGVLGLQSNGGAADGTRFLKMDENHHRLAPHPGPRDDIAYAGWAIRDEASLRALVEQLASHGGRVTWGTPAEAIARRVMGQLHVQDPSGIAHEVCWGPQLETECTFRSPRAMGGLETGDLGLGHIVLAVNGDEASLRFYRDGLGLRISDYIELDMGHAGQTAAAFLHSGARHHWLAIAQFPAPRRLHHFMLQLRGMVDIGSTHDLCQDLRIPIASTLGRHTNDLMASFYMVKPSGFQVEYGHGGREIDDDVWEVERHHAASLWGHRTQTATPLLAATPAS